jgi:hypothetical protein
LIFSIQLQKKNIFVSCFLYLKPKEKERQREDLLVSLAESGAIGFSKVLNKPASVFFLSSLILMLSLPFSTALSFFFKKKVSLMVAFLLSLSHCLMYCYLWVSLELLMVSLIAMISQNRFFKFVFIFLF